jgi:hypothetical protein
MTLTSQILAVGGIVVFIVLLVSIIRAILNERKIRHSPIISVDAVVLKRIYHESGSEENVLHRSWSIEFKIGNSEIKRFSVGKERYPQFKEGLEGTLSYQHTRFKSFKPRD